VECHYGGKRGYYIVERGEGIKLQTILTKRGNIGSIPKGGGGRTYTARDIYKRGGKEEKKRDAKRHQSGEGGCSRA